MRYATNLRSRGFAHIGIVILILVLAVIGGAGVYVYHANHKAKASTVLNKSTNNSSPTPSPQSTTHYLEIKEWSVKLPLSSSIEDAYYTVQGSSTGADGLPNTAWLGLTSLNSSGCNVANTGPATSATPIGSIIRVLPTDHDPVTGKLYTQQYPNGVTVSGYFYAFKPWGDAKCASASTLQSIDAAFGVAVQGLVKITSMQPTVHYLDIKEWGVRVPYSGSLILSYKIDGRYAYFSSAQLTDLSSDCVGRGGAIVRWASTDQVSEGPPDASSPTAATYFAGKDPSTIPYAHIGNYYYMFAHDQAACGDLTTTAALQSQTNDAVKVLVPKLQASPN